MNTNYKIHSNNINIYEKERNHNYRSKNQNFHNYNSFRGSIMFQNIECPMYTLSVINLPK